MAVVELKDGASCLFWDDLWCNRVPKIQFPELYSFSRDKNISLMNFVDAVGPESVLRLPISPQAFQQLTSLLEDINNLHFTEEHDIWPFIWGSPFFSSSKAYKHLTGHRITHASFKWLWSSAVQHKHKVFFWLLLQDRLSTRSLLRRKNMFLPDYNCFCCTT